MRKVLMLSVCLPLALAACATGTSTAPATTSSLTQAEQDAAILTAGLQGIAADVALIPGADATQVANVQAALAAVQKQIAAFQALPSPTVSDVQLVQSVISALGAAATPFFAASPLVAVAVNAAITLGQTIFMEVGGVGAAPVSGMGAAAARLVLRGAAAH